nr:MAG TPA: hypothetical protein [Caudoviricetes sp.]
MALLQNRGVKLCQLKSVEKENSKPMTPPRKNSEVATKANLPRLRRPRKRLLAWSTMGKPSKSLARWSTCNNANLPNPCRRTTPLVSRKPSRNTGLPRKTRNKALQYILKGYIISM